MKKTKKRFGRGHTGQVLAMFDVTHRLSSHKGPSEHIPNP